MERGPAVVHVVNSLQTGGLERVVSDQVIWRSARSRTAVLCLESLGFVGESLAPLDIPVCVAGFEGGKIQTIRRSLAFVREFRASLLHAHNLQAHIFSTVVAILAGGLPVVYTAHGFRGLSPGLVGTVSRWLAMRSHVVAVSEDLRREMQRQRTPFSKPFTMVANGVDLSTFAALPPREEARADLGWPPGGFLAGMVARLVPLKDHLGLLASFAEVVKARPDARLMIVGDGEMREAIETEIRRLQLTGAVAVLGERHDIPTILAALDVFVLKSMSEGMPITILEAMAAGLPVVASRVGGVPEVVDDGATGCVVGNHPPEMAQALLRLAADPQLCARMGKAGRLKAQREFSIEATGNNYNHLYEAVLASR